MDPTQALRAQQVEPGFFAAPQLSPEDMPALAAAGVRSVINNRPDGEGGAQQPSSDQLQAAARAAGLEYRYLPVPSSGHSDADARRMAQLVGELPRPVLAFCRSGRRSAALYLKGKTLPSPRPGADP
jgi:uncharacterized protein (TIGR01244 family)